MKLRSNGTLFCLDGIVVRILRWDSRIFRFAALTSPRSVAVGIVLGFAFLSGCHTLSNPEEGPSSHHPAYFISLDGVRPDHLEKMVEGGVLPLDQGIGQLIKTGQVSYQAQADGTTLTSASHASMITCSSPAEHGVIANTFYARDPSNHQLIKRDGFFTHHQTETLWKAARRQGKRVLSLSYPDAATGTVDDQPDVWLAYPPPSTIEKGRVETLRWSKLPMAKDWILPPDLSDLRLPTAQAREAELVLKLSPETNETRTIHILILNHPEPQIYFDDDKDLAIGHYGVLTEKRPGFVDFFFVELNPHSSTRERKRHISIRWLEQDRSDSIKLAISASTYNNAYPESFLKDLERANLVWPDSEVPDLSAEKTGISPLEYVEWQYRLNRFLVDGYEVAKRYGPYDLVLFYQPLIDAFGHNYESQLPEPFDLTRDLGGDLAKKSEVLEGYKLAYRLVSHNVNDMIKDDIGFSPIVMVSDHGMEALETEVNLARSIPPVPAGIILQPAGGSLLIYSDLAPAAWASWYAKTIATLKDLAWKNHSVLRSEQQRPLDSHSWNYGDAQAVLVAAPHVQFVVRTERSKILDVPKKNGAHGYPISDSEMSTVTVVNSPGREAGVFVGATQLKDAVPTLSELMNIQPPRQCSGHSMKKFVPNGHTMPVVKKSQ